MNFNKTLKRGIHVTIAYDWLEQREHSPTQAVFMAVFSAILTLFGASTRRVQIVSMDLINHM